jgi:hypothetical protein
MEVLGAAPGDQRDDRIGASEAGQNVCDAGRGRGELGTRDDR